MDNISSTDFLYSPLWRHSQPEDWKDLSGRFTQAMLDLDAGFEPWVNWYKDRVAGKELNKEQEEAWLDVPAEIRAAGAQATNTYLARLVQANIPQTNNLQALNLVRAIFIGSGDAGKTSLIRKLHNEPVIEGKEKMTAGIEVRQWPIPDSEIKAKFWDFGGQVMSHSTHQFFLREKCLYILVLEAKSGINIDDEVEYWLEHVKAFGNSAPVILVGNKSDLIAVNLSMNTLKEKYPNIVNFYRASCTSQDEEFIHYHQLFRDELVNQLKVLGTHQIMFNKNEFDLLEKVRELSREDAFMDYDKFDELCKQHNIGQQPNSFSQQEFLEILDNLGEIIHFPDMRWTDDYVLNPRWLTYGVYTLLFSDIAEIQKGELSDQDVVDILSLKVIEDENGNQLTYPKKRCRFIIDAMSNFKLCYRLPDDSRFVIPDKLPAEQPDLTDDFDKNSEGTLAFEFNFAGLLPRNVMPNLIVARHKEIVRGKQDKQLVWQHGVIVDKADGQARARLQVDYHQGVLLLWVQGEGAREYLLILRDEIRKILSIIKGLNFEENVILPAFARININEERFRPNAGEVERATYQRLMEETKAKPKRKRVFSDAGNEYDLEKVMGFIMTDERQNKEGVSQAITIHGNVGVLTGAGDNHTVIGTEVGNTVLSESNKQDIHELKESLSVLMTHVEKRDADFSVKAAAYAELQEINNHLDDLTNNGLENITPETRTKLVRFFGSVKDGSLAVIKLLKGVKENEELLSWLTKKALEVSTFLAASSL